MTARMLAVVVLVVLGVGWLAAAEPSLEGGVDVLLMLCEPYGANAGLLRNNVERLGWTVELTGTNTTVANCSFLTTPLPVNRTIASIDDPSVYDVVIVSPTPGTFNPTVDPAAELRGNPDALELIRHADQAGLTLFGGCSALAVLGDAGVLDGHAVLYHPSLGSSTCRAFGAASCKRSGPGTPPLVDANIVSATNQRYFALEIPEALARSLDQLDRFEPSLDHIVGRDLALEAETLAPEGAFGSVFCLGTPGSEGVLDLCALESGYAVVGYVYAPEGGNADVLVVRLDDAGRLLWAKRLGGPGRDIGYGICSVPGGGLAVAGLTTSAGSGGEDVLLFSLDEAGNLQWIRSFGGPGHEAAFDLTCTRDGLAMTGIREGEHVDRSAIWTLATDHAGELRWDTITDGRMYERGLSIIERLDGSLLVAGGTTSQGAGNYDMFLVSYDANGQELWSETYGKKQYNLAEAVLESRDGSLAVVGYGDIESGDPNDLELVIADADGTYRKRTTLGPGRSFDYGQDLCDLPNGELVLCGATGHEGTDSNDAWLVRCSANGDVHWQHTYGLRTGHEWLNAVVRGTDGAVLAAGWTTSSGVGRHDLLFAFVAPDALP